MPTAGDRTSGNSFAYGRAMRARDISCKICVIQESIFFLKIDLESVRTHPMAMG